MRPDDENSRRKRSFGQEAENYARYRPQPPAVAVEWLLPPGAEDVLEIGAGTGALTGRLTERCRFVRAIEPDDRMRAILVGAATGADVVSGVAEKLPADDHTFDAAIAATAWHWVDEARALPEVARVLRPGGTFALLWCGPDRTIDWIRTLWAGGTSPKTEEQKTLVERWSDHHVVHLPTDGTFTRPEHTIFQWAQPMTRGDLVGLVGTYSAFITMDSATRQVHQDGMVKYLDELAQFADNDLVPVPMRCRCWRSTVG